MTLLDSLHSDANVAVIGASGGIGRAFVDWLEQEDRVATIHAYSRTARDWSSPKVSGGSCDLMDEQSIQAAAAAATAAAPLDLVIVATGILHREPDISPEKSMRELQPEALAEVYAINTIGPTLAAKHFLPKLRRDHKSVFAAVSARVGSIADNRLGGWAAYRMSKAALNMMIKTLAIEQARRNSESVVIAVHPGTVDTSLSKPFTGRTAADAIFTPAESTEKMLRVMNALTAEESGGFFAYDQSRIEY